MPFKRNDLWVLAFAKGFTLWRYRSHDREMVEGYFDPAHDLLQSGDMILACLREPPDTRVGLYVVTANAGGAVQFDDLSPEPSEEPILPEEPDPPHPDGTESHIGRRRLTRLARLASAKEQHALTLRNADSTARGERAAGDAERDAAAIRWALEKLEPNPEQACVEGFFGELSMASKHSAATNPPSGR